MQAPTPVIPSLLYSQNLKTQLAKQEVQQTAPLQRVAYADQSKLIIEDKQAQRAHLHFVAEVDTTEPAVKESDSPPDVVTNDPAYEVHRSNLIETRDYNGPLSLGDPGVTASLWRESRGTNDIFRDQRAWQPMDLITIIISESSEGSKEADTETKSSSSVQAAIEQLLTFDDDMVEANPSKLDPTSLINASTKNEFKGEGGTARKGKLKASISAMVAEVLPSGVIRIEGQKIISVNSEEQVMVISGLVRPRDINSANEVQSAKIANMRIDYYGNGIVGEAQYGGWLGRILRVIWPF